MEEAQATEETIEAADADVTAEEIEASTNAEEIAAAVAAAEGETGNAESGNSPKAAGTPKESGKE